jgi:hypothetical protein
MKYLVSVCVFCLLLGSTSCEKNEQRPISHELIGHWRWLYSLGGLNGKQVMTPAAGTVSTYRFTPDSSWTQCYNGKCDAPTKFTLRTERSVLFGSNRLILTLRRRARLAPPDTGSVLIKDRYLVDELSNELHIAQDTPDGFGEYYSRQ